MEKERKPDQSFRKGARCVFRNCYTVTYYDYDKSNAVIDETVYSKIGNAVNAFREVKQAIKENKEVIFITLEIID